MHVVWNPDVTFIKARDIRSMAALQSALLYGCCNNFNSCCSTVTGVWYLCLAIIILLILVSCNDILKSRCYFLGFPWSNSKVYIIQETSADEQCQLLLTLDEDNIHHLEEELHPPPPPPYSMFDD